MLITRQFYLAKIIIFVVIYKDLRWDIDSVMTSDV